jgi:hypothetical protein
VFSVRLGNVEHTETSLNHVYRAPWSNHGMLRAIMDTELGMASVQQRHVRGPITDELATSRHPGSPFEDACFLYDFS